MNCITCGKPIGHEGTLCCWECENTLPPQPRETILKTAAKIVCGDREKEYGTPERNFDKISRLWNAYLGDNVTDAHDVAMMMCLLKVARIRTGQAKEDNYIDLAGYASCAGEIKRGE